MKPTTRREYLEEALSLALKALDLDPENRLAAATLGLAYLRTGKPAAAILQLERALKNESAQENEPQELCLGLGEAYCHAGQPEKAQKYFQDALGEKGLSPAAWLLTACCLLDLGNLEAAATAFSRTAELDCRVASAQSMFASVCALLGRYETAIEAYSRRAGGNAASAFDLCAAAACLLAAGAEEKALAALEKDAPGPAEKLTSLDRSDAATAASDGFFSALRGSYTRAVLAKAWPDLMNCRRGADLLILRVCGRIISAIAGGTPPLREPHRLPGYLKCALYWKLAMHDKNIERCQRMLMDDSGDPLAAQLLFKSYKAIGAPDKAIGFYKYLLKRNSRDIGAALRATDICLELEDMDLALVYCRKALDIEPENLRANYNIGLILLRKDMAYAALPYLQKAAAPVSASAETLLALGEAQARVKNRPAARRAWEQAAENDAQGDCGRQAQERLAALNEPRNGDPPPSAEPPAGPAQTEHKPQITRRKSSGEGGAPEQGGS